MGTASDLFAPHGALLSFKFSLSFRVLSFYIKKTWHPHAFFPSSSWLKGLGYNLVQVIPYTGQFKLMFFLDFTWFGNISVLMGCYPIS